MILGGRHVGIPVTHMGKALEFYSDLLGFRKVVDEIEEGPFIEHLLALSVVRIHIVKLIAPDGWKLELLQYLQGEGKARISPKLNDMGCAHLALTVDDIDLEYQRLSAAGVRFNNTPRISPNGYAKVAFCQDPDGNFIELVQVFDAKRARKVSPEAPHA